MIVYLVFEGQTKLAVSRVGSCRWMDGFSKALDDASFADNGAEVLPNCGDCRFVFRDLGFESLGR